MKILKKALVLTITTIALSGSMSHAADGWSDPSDVKAQIIATAVLSALVGAGFSKIASLAMLWTPAKLIFKDVIWDLAVKGLLYDVLAKGLLYEALLKGVVWKALGGAGYAIGGVLGPHAGRIAGIAGGSLGIMAGLKAIFS